MTTKQGRSLEICEIAPGQIRILIKGSEVVAVAILNRAEAYDIAVELYKMSDHSETINDGQTNKAR